MEVECAKASKLAHIPLGGLFSINTTDSYSLSCSSHLVGCSLFLHVSALVVDQTSRQQKCCGYMTWTKAYLSSAPPHQCKHKLCILHRAYLFPTRGKPIIQYSVGTCFHQIRSEKSSGNVELWMCKFFFFFLTEKVEKQSGQYLKTNNSTFSLPFISDLVGTSACLGM